MIENVLFDFPLPLIEVDSNNSFRLNKETLTKIRSISGYVSVISVCGLFRTGKSSMLNWLMGSELHFKIGSTINRCTRGIWVYGKTDATLLSNGEYGKVLVLDTEGIGSTSSDINYDSKIFSLSLLICSTLVYNSMGSIDEATISNLSFIANLSKNIKISESPASNGPETDEEEAAKFHQIFPAFVWVLRDFSLSLTDKGGSPITEDQYLSSALQACKGYDRQTLERNRIRHMISSFFPHKKCISLVRPVSDEETLQRAGELPLHELRPEFQSGMARLKEAIFGCLRPNSLNGRCLTGPMYADLLEAYVTAIEQGGVPTIQSAWEGVCVGECCAAVDDGANQYRAILDQTRISLPREAVDIRTLHDSAKSAALLAYNSRAAGERRSEKQQLLERDCDLKLLQIEAANTEASKEQCMRLLNELFDRYVRNNLFVSGKDSTANAYLSVERLNDRYSNDWAALLQQYEKEGRGPAKATVLAAFCAEKIPSCTDLLVSSTLAQTSDKQQVLHLKFSEADRERAALQAEALIMRDECARLAYLLQKSNEKEASDGAASLLLELEELRRQKRSAERAAETERDQKERALAAVATLRHRISILEAKEEECEELKWIIMQKNDQLATMTGIFTPRKAQGGSPLDSRNS